MDVMHGMKQYLAEKKGYGKAPGALMSKCFFDNILKRGRLWEFMLANTFYMKSGPAVAMREAMKQADIGRPLVLKKRLPLMPPKAIKGKGDLKKIYEKAAALAKEGH